MSGRSRQRARRRAAQRALTPAQTKPLEYKGGGTLPGSEPISEDEVPDEAIVQAFVILHNDGTLSVRSAVQMGVPDGLIEDCANAIHDTIMRYTTARQAKM